MRKSVRTATLYPEKSFIQIARYRRSSLDGRGIFDSGRSLQVEFVLLNISHTTFRHCRERSYLDNLSRNSCISSRQICTTWRKLHLVDNSAIVLAVIITKPAHIWPRLSLNLGKLFLALSRPILFALELFKTPVSRFMTGNNGKGTSRNIIQHRATSFFAR